MTEHTGDLLEHLRDDHGQDVATILASAAVDQLAQFHDEQHGAPVQVWAVRRARPTRADFDRADRLQALDRITRDPRESDRIEAAS